MSLVTISQYKNFSTEYEVSTLLKFNKTSHHITIT